MTRDAINSTCLIARVAWKVDPWGFSWLVAGFRFWWYIGDTESVIVSNFGAETSITFTPVT